MRIPGWCPGATLAVNGRSLRIELHAGYAQIHRQWRAGDVIELELPMELRFESTPDDRSVVAALYGPMVLAADMGREGNPLPPDQAPALVGAHLPDLFRGGVSAGSYHAETVPQALSFRPFFEQYDQRTAVYFRVFGTTDWPAEIARRQAIAEERRTIQTSSIDLFRPTDPESERKHDLTEMLTTATPYRSVGGRLIKPDGYLQITMRVADGPTLLHLTFWGDADRGVLDILVEDRKIGEQRLAREHPGVFFESSHAIPVELTRGKQEVRIRFVPRPNTRGPVLYGCRTSAATENS
jgi:hypothetical protein